MSGACGQSSSATLTQEFDVSDRLLLRKGVRHNPSGPFGFPWNPGANRSGDTADFEVIVRD
jgi:hypothetical protein